jgi:iron(III) transport system substrate-binding protein
VWLSRRKYYVAGSVAAALLLAAGCSSSGGQASDAGANTPAASTPAGNSTGGGAAQDDALIKAAQGEGSLTLYTAATQVAAKAQADAFTKKYDVKVNMVRMTGAQLTQRVEAEAKAGQPAADVLVTSDPVMVKTGMGEGWLTPLEKADIPGYPWDFPERFLQKDYGSAVVLLQMTGIAYNTDLVKGDDIPKGWEDLLDPKWQGKIGIADLKSSLGYTAEWVVIDKLMGGDYLSKLGKQNLKVYASGAPASAALGAGEIPLLADQLITNVVPVKEKGAPVAWVIPDKTTSLDDYVALVTKAKSPNAAKLFTKYIMSQEGADVLAKASHSTSPFDTTAIPSGYQPLNIFTAADQQADTMRLLGVS